MDLQYTSEVDSYAIVRSLYGSIFHTKVFGRKDRWRTNIRAICPEVEVIKSYETPIGVTYCGWVDSCFVFVEHFSQLEVEICGDSSFEIHKTLDILQEHYQKDTRNDISQVAVNFWSNTSQGGVARYRKISVPSWDEIRLNYPTATRDQLEKTVRNDFIQSPGGNLILWTGRPGTGKTYAIRALLQTLQDTDYHYILDPEQFFGADANYMMNVLISSNPDEPETYNQGSRTRTNLLIFEDVGELLSTDAKVRTGQGFARLLNVTEGLIGQGLNLVVLMTSNDKAENFHEAVFRNGRCKSQIHFETFDKTEASEWLIRNGGSYTNKNNLPLSDLFALRGGGISKSAEIRTGF